jgi:hypothetical protein
MPLNEATRVRRERWPLAFDLEGLPRDTAVRNSHLEHEKLKEEIMNTHPVANNFAVDYQAGNNVIDINNPPKKAYNPHAPENQFPKMIYPATWPAAKAITVGSEQELQAKLKKGFELKPPSRVEPSEADLDAVEEEKEVVARTAGKKAKS